MDAPTALVAEQENEQLGRATSSQSGVAVETPFSRWLAVKPRLYGGGAFITILGVALGTFSAPPILLLLVAASASLLAAAPGGRRLAVIATALLMTGYGYGLYRLPRPGSNDVSELIGRRVTLCGVIESVRVANSGSSNIILRTNRLEYPERKSISGRLNLIVVPVGGSVSPPEAKGSRKPIPGIELQRKPTVDEAGKPTDAMIGAEATEEREQQSCIDEGALSASVSKRSTDEVTEARDGVLPTNRPGAGESPESVGRAISNEDITSDHLLKPGVSISITAILRAPLHARHPYDFDVSDALARRGIFCEARLNHKSVTFIKEAIDDSHSDLYCSQHPLQCIACHSSACCEKLVDYLRSRIVTTHQSVMGNDNGAVLSSMVLGDRAVDLSDETQQQFRDAGLSHVLAASGYNLTVVVLIVTFAAKLILRSHVLISGWCLFGITVFVLLAGVSPSISRAAVMCTIVLLSQCVRRRPHMPAVLVTALLLAAVWNPGSLADIGLQLSYVATAAMIFGTHAVTKPVSRLPPRIGQFAELAGTTLLAQASVFPLQLLYFYESSIYFLPANIVAALIVPLICSLGFASSVCVLMATLVPCAGWLALLLDRINSIPLAVLMYVVKGIALLPGAVASLGAPPLYAVIVFYGALVALFIFGWRRQARVWVLTGLLIGVIGLLVRETLEKELTITVGHNKILIRKDRTATCVGRPNPRRLRRILSYYGARLIK